MLGFRDAITVAFLLGFAAISPLKMPAQCTDQGVIPATFTPGPDYRSLVSGAIGATPAIGSALSGITKFLWSDDSQQQVFNALVAYVNQVVPGMIAQEHVQQLQQHVVGLRAVLNDYNQTTDPVQKGEYLTTLISLLDELEPEFFDPRTPERTLAHFVAFGSIRLVALREQYLFAAQYYGADPDRAAHLTLLQSNIARYTKAAADIRSRAMEWRLGMVNFAQNSTWNYGVRSKQQIFHTSTRDDFCNANVNSYSGPSYPRSARSLHAAYVAKVRAAFNHQLDLIMQPTTDWPKLNAVAPPPAHALLSAQGNSQIITGSE
jgi:delta endotoxin, N-terminal domain